MVRKWFVRSVVLMLVVPAAAALAQHLADRLERRSGPSTLTKGLRFAGERGRRIAGPAG
jgi:hypothetical protein